MKKLGDLMKDLGFRADSSTPVKEAFLKHLIKTTCGVSVIPPSEKRHVVVDENHAPLAVDKQGEAQLCFDLDNCG